MQMVEAQDIETGKVYTDGEIVFTVDKTRPISDYAMVIITKRGKRILTHNGTKVRAL
jgi:hypothetical protein